jgi:hypothetical protein
VGDDAGSHVSVIAQIGFEKGKRTGTHASSKLFQEPDSGVR